MSKKMTIAQHITSVSGYRNALAMANKICVVTEQDFMSDTTVFEFEDGSMLKFNSENNSIETA